MENGIVVREQSVAEEGSKITIKYRGSFEQFMNKEQPVPDQAAPPTESGLMGFARDVLPFEKSAIWYYLKAMALMAITINL